jgi:hypothetical protein
MAISESIMAILMLLCSIQFDCNVLSRNACSMYILHGTWIPDETDSFIQPGQFYLWVETDTAPTRRTAGVHPNHLRTAELDRFLRETLGISPLAAVTYMGKRSNPTIARNCAAIFSVTECAEMAVTFLGDGAVPGSRIAGAG